MDKKNIDILNFDEVIFLNEKEYLMIELNNPITLINKWSEYILKNNIKDEKRLYIKNLIIRSNPSYINMVNINIENFKQEYRDINVSLKNSNIKNLFINENNNFSLKLENTIINEILINENISSSLSKIKLIGDIYNTSTIKVFKIIDNKILDENNSVLYLLNLNISELELDNLINLSKKFKIFNCLLDYLIIKKSDIGEIILVDNHIKNLIVESSIIIKAKLINNVIDNINTYKYYITTNEDRKWEYLGMKLLNFFNKFDSNNKKQLLDLNRQLKLVMDDNRMYNEADKYYSKEMFLKMKLEKNYFKKILLYFHFFSSNFGTNYIRSLGFIFFIAFLEIVIRYNHLYKTNTGLLEKIKYFLNYGINSLDLDIFISEVLKNIFIYFSIKNIEDINLLTFLLIIFMSYGIYQFINSVRRLTKR